MLVCSANSYITSHFLSIQKNHFSHGNHLKTFVNKNICMRTTLHQNKYFFHSIIISSMFYETHKTKKMKREYGTINLTTGSTKVEPTELKLWLNHSVMNNQQSILHCRDHVPCIIIRKKIF